MKQKMILRNFKLHMQTSQNVLHLGTSYIILKISWKKTQKKNRAVWTEERREKRKERMSEIWRERKTEGSNWNERRAERLIRNNN